MKKINVCLIVSILCLFLSSVLSAEDLSEYRINVLSKDPSIKIVATRFYRAKNKNRKCKEWNYPFWDIDARIRGDRRLVQKTMKVAIHGYWDHGEYILDIHNDAAGGVCKYISTNIADLEFQKGKYPGMASIGVKRSDLVSFEDVQKLNCTLRDIPVKPYFHLDCGYDETIYVDINGRATVEISMY